ncbi:short subunit dehydrogenase [Flavobacterium aciduliphilum]|uniref:Short subunit dehydrogenase n=2 Tax=Flavobacterium aciduliphilum TaxID=1101402 RepID=A0A328YKU9_9FLAO|nr:short subunit dehydrogenase [Flavobacterium aciduliphilum]
MGYRSFVELAEDNKIEAITKVNWLGVVKMCRAFIPHFRAQKKGQFINISSIAGSVNLPLGNFYHSTKHAVESFSECMAYELRPFNIAVATVQFGNIPSNFQKNVKKSETTEIDSYNNMMKKVDAIVQKKTEDNQELLTVILDKLYHIAENPSKGFKKYAVGFDAHFMISLRRIVGYRIFNFIIRNAILKK